jgi:hypothetical protein
MEYVRQRRLALVVVGALAVLPVSCPAPGTPQSGPVDLAPGAMTSTETSVADGATLGVSLPIQNLGSAAESAAFTVEFHLVLTGTFDPSIDALVGSSIVSSGVGAGSTVTLNTTLTIPELNINQDAYVYAVVDAASAVTETDETNNRSSTTSALVILISDNENGSRTYPLKLETYAPTGTATTDTVMALYLDNGLGTAVTYVGSDVSGGSDYSTLDYTGAGLAPGTYYLMVASFSGRNGPYAFTARTTNIARPIFAGNLADNAADSWEPDDAPQVSDIPNNTTVPTAPVTMGAGRAMNRYSAMNDWDWFRFVLP